MALFVHITQRCEEEAASAGWQDDMEKLKNKVEQAQGLLGFQHFPKPYRIKKQWPRYNARLIASVHEYSFLFRAAGGVELGRNEDMPSTCWW